MSVGLKRRELLRRFPFLLIGGWQLAACRLDDVEPPAQRSGDEDMSSSPDLADPLSTREGLEAAGWVEVSLDEHPELLESGGYIVVTRESPLLDVYLISGDEPGRFWAAWRVCTHGACHVEFRPSSRMFWCPCHGSLFGEDGTPFTGPATVPLGILGARRVDGSVWIEPPY